MESKKKETKEFVINEILLESMMAGLTQSCGALSLSDLGKRAVGAFMGGATIDYEKVARAVFARNYFQPMNQEEFLYGFIEQLQRGQRLRNYKGLVAYLDSEQSVKPFKDVCNFLGTRFGTLYCALGIKVIDDSAERGILTRSGDYVSYVPKAKRIVA